MGERPARKFREVADMKQTLSLCPAEYHGDNAHKASARIMPNPVILAPRSSAALHFSAPRRLAMSIALALGLHPIAFTTLVVPVLIGYH